MEMATSPWSGIRWIALGLVALLIGFVWCLVAARQVRLRLYAHHYVAAEFEVTRFVGKPRNSRARASIEGVVHPDGERLVTSDRDIAIKRFIRPEDRTRNEPLAAEIEGQRLAISYWPRHAETKRWWHPPTVVSQGQIPSGAVALANGLLGGAIFGFGLFCFPRGFRILKATAPPAAERTKTKWSEAEGVSPSEAEGVSP